MSIFSIFSKKKNSIAPDKHSGRFGFEYLILPSAATFAPTQLFSPDNEGSELFDLLFIDDDMRAASWVKEYIKNSSMTIYSVAGGQISMLKFPEPDASPELAYAAVPIADHLLVNMKEEEDIYYRPFYILAKMVDKWCIGEVKYDKDRDDGFYYVEYYKMVDKADPVEFIKWVMEREGFSKCDDVEQDDPVAKFLREGSTN